MGADGRVTLPVRSQKSGMTVGHAGEIHSSLDLIPLCPIYCQRHNGGISALPPERPAGLLICKQCNVIKMHQSHPAQRDADERGSEQLVCFK